jgi:hypothetical protein
VQAWDRYAYVNNNPLRYNDPNGHDVGCAGQDATVCYYEQHGIPLAQNPSYNPNPPTSHYTPIPIFPSQNSNTTAATTIGPPPGSQPAAPLPLFGPEAIEFLGNAASDGSSIIPAIVSGITKGVGGVSEGGAPNGPGMLAGGIASAITQAYKDRNIPLTLAQRVGRVAVTTVVKGTQSTVASVVGVNLAGTAAALGIETGPLSVGLAATGYVAGYAGIMTLTSGIANDTINNLYSQFGLTPY